jgi:glycerol dehydrogenase
MTINCLGCIALYCTALYSTVPQHGIQAAADCTAKIVTDSFETVVEANILLSGLGVECGGLAVAHGLHNALTRLPETHSLMHGQKVRKQIC